MQADSVKCDHGVVFDEEEAKRISATTPPRTGVGADVDFILGDPAAPAIRKRFPRLNGPCPKGCGFVGIAYASTAHYAWGDW